MRKPEPMAPPFVSCGNCSQDGWIDVQHADGSKAERCQCWHAHHARLKALALPPASDPEAAA